MSGGWQPRSTAPAAASAPHVNTTARPGLLTLGISGQIDPPESGSRLAPVQALYAPPESPHAAPSTLRRHGCPQLATLDEPGTPDAPWARSQIIRPAASRCLGGAGSSDLGASRLRGPARREVVSRALREPSRPRSRARAPIPTPLSISQRQRSAQQPQQRQATRK